MELPMLYKRVIGLDVHQAQITACALIEESDGATRIEQRQFGAFKKDRRALADWAAQLNPDEVVMESSGIYWKSPYAALETVGIRAKVVNARHVKNVPGRKTDINDAQWLATLSRAGLLRPSFIPPAKLRELRLIARQRKKLTDQLASEKNRLHKVLTDGGIRLGVVVSDVHGQSARSMIKALIADKTTQEVLKFASQRLKASRDELFGALQGELTESHRFVLDELMQHIEEIEQRIVRFDQHLLARLKSEHNWLALLQTLPGIDLIGAAMLLVEIGADMDAFGSADHLASWVVSVQAITSQQANVNPAECVKAMPMFGVFYVNSPMPPAVPPPFLNQSFSRSSCDVGTNAPSWPWPTKYYAPSFSCSSGANITGIALPTMKNSLFSVTLRAGSKR